MATVTLTTQNFQEHVEKPGILLIDWWATWCGPCRAFAPIYEKAADKHADVVFGKVDTDAEQELAATFEIRSIPRPGMMPGPALDELVEKVKALDMADVHRKVAEQEAESAKRDADGLETSAEKTPEKTSAEG
jgi:thioredoxin 1